MTAEEIKQDCLARLDAVRREIESGKVRSFAIITPGGQVLWQHSSWPASTDPYLMIAGLEACKLDVVRHSARCSCEGP